MNLVKVLKATLEEHEGDVIYFLDACYGASSLASSPGKELIASSSFEMVPTTDDNHVTTGFTSHLCESLSERQGKPNTLAHLHARLIRYRITRSNNNNETMDLETTPVHTELHPNQKNSLILAPLGFRNPSVPWPNEPLHDPSEPKVQITVHLHHTTIPDLQNWVINTWLTQSKPPFIRSQEITIASACQTGTGSSLLVTFIIPAAIHNTMHSHPAYQMVSYVASNNIWLPPQFNLPYRPAS